MVNKMTSSTDSIKDPSKMDELPPQVSYTLTENGEEKEGGERLGMRISALGANGGTVRNIEENGDIILIPTPSDDPNDPLNWSRGFKWYMTCVVCMAVFMSNMTAAGPSIAILQTSATFGTLPPKTAYVYSCASLMQGTSMFLWSPLTSKFGKRPMYIFSYILYLIMCFVAGASKDWATHLGIRMVLGAASGAGEMLGPLTINDIWYVHERSTPMAAYQAFLSVGVAFGMIIDGAITTNYDWRTIYWVSGPILAVLCILVTFTFPETSYRRPALQSVTKNQQRRIDHSTKKTFIQNLRIFHGTWTDESFFTLFYRPWVAVILPPVAYAMLTFAVTVGAVVAVTSNVALAYGLTYQMGPKSVGLCFFAGVIGSLIGIFFGGFLTDWTSHRAVVKNNGIREPEMRLPSILSSLISAPLSLVLYGAGIHFKWHFIVPTIGLGLINFTIVSGTNIAMVYAIDSYKPISEEVVTAILGYKGFIGFLLSFYTNVWVVNQGYLNSYSEFAGISAFVFLLAAPLYIWGKQIREASMKWKAFKLIKWNDDRDDMVIETD